MRRSIAILSVTAVLSICSADGTARGDVVGRSEFLANTSTLGDQRRPVVAMYQLKVKSRRWFPTAAANGGAADTRLTVTIGTQCFTRLATLKIDD